MADVSPPFTEDFRFTGPTVAISCRVRWDEKRAEYLAVSSHGFRGASVNSATDAALACFTAWMVGTRGWFTGTEGDASQLDLDYFRTKLHAIAEGSVELLQDPALIRSLANDMLLRLER